MDAVYSTKPATFQELQQAVERCCAATLVAACHLLTAIICAVKPNNGHETATPDFPVTK